MADYKTDRKSVSGPGYPLLLALAGDDKYAVAFATGAVMALRDMGLLQAVKVASATGMCNVVLAELAATLGHVKDTDEASSIELVTTATTTNAVTAHASGPPNLALVHGRRWQRLGQAPETHQEDVLRERFVSAIVRFADANTEWAILRSRLQRPWSWLDPWPEEWQRLLTGADGTPDMLHTLGLSWRGDRHEDQPRDAPIWLFNGRKADGCCAVSFTSDQRPPRLTRMQNITFVPATRGITLARLVPLVASPNEWRGALVGLESGVETEVVNSTDLDPFAMEAVDTYYLRGHMGDAMGSRLLLLVDGYTGGRQYLQEDIRNQDRCRVLHAQLLGAEDARQEHVRSFRDAMVQCFDPMFEGQHESDVDGATSGIADSPETGPAAFYRTLRDSDCRLESADPALVDHCMNWGYLLAHKRWHANYLHRVNPAQLPRPSRLDTFELHRALYPRE